MPGLLVSVRSASEAAAALAGGADLIDVKEPQHGSLGRADASVVRAVIETVANRRPVSAALGELRDEPHRFSEPNLSWVKWGLAGLGTNPRWKEMLEHAAAVLRASHPACQPVAVAYADAELAQSPPPSQVLAFAIARSWQAFLLDTWTKDGRSLLDWISVGALERLRTDCRAAGIQIALAGSLNAEQIEHLLPLAPDWFAVRTAACRDGHRTGPICADRVAILAQKIHHGWHR